MKEVKTPKEIRTFFKDFADFSYLKALPHAPHNHDLIYWQALSDYHAQEGDRGADNRVLRVGQGTAHKTTQLWGTVFRFYNFLQYVKRNSLNVLDLGCDDAFVRRMIHSGTYVSGTRYIGVDIKKAFLEKASDNMPTCNTPALFVCHDLYQGLPFIQDDSADIILCMELLEHLEEAQGLALLKDLYRTLRTNGVLYLTMPNHDPSYWYVWKKYREHGYPWHHREYTLKEFLKLAKKLGFTVVRYYGNLANRKRLEPLLTPEERPIYDDMVAYMGPQVPVQIFGQRHVEACGGVVYILTKRKED